MIRRFLLVLLLTVGAVLPAGAAWATTDKAALLAAWTQPTATSTNAWNTARRERARWADFDWSTDYCSASPDRPLGFDFSLACWHHDFGYRNYKDLGRFRENKARVDDTFYADLRRKCATYSPYVRPACLSLAWTYYQAVHVFGSVKVKRADLDRAAALV